MKKFFNFSGSRRKSRESKTNRSSKRKIEGGRTNHYAASAACESSSVERISKKLLQDLRHDIKDLGMYPVLSPKWSELVECVKRIANISDMESKLPKKEKRETLWDSQEVALRYILEDEKLNLCLRLIHDMKTFQYEVLGSKAQLTSEDDALLVSFEGNLGAILRRAWAYVEAMQTTDLSLLMEHCALVLQKALLHPKLCVNKNLCKNQESQVLYYIRELLKHTSDDAFPSRRVMHYIEANAIVERIVMFVNMNHKHLAACDRLAACEALALIFDTDEYSIDKTKFVGPDLRQELVSLHGNAIADLVEADREVKKRIRPLLNQISLFELSAGK